MFADQPNDALEEAPRTATFTYTVTTFANPFAVCEKCHRPVSGYYNAPGHGMDRRNVPCRHLGVLSACMSWSPVDGWSRPDPMARAVRGVQLFGKSYTHLFAGTRGPDDVDAVVRSFERAIARLR